MVTTGFSVSYYYAGTTEAETKVNNYTKTLVAEAEVGLSGGGENTLGGSPAYKKGASGISSWSETYLYSVSAILGNHSFKCNGGSTSFWTNE